MYSHIVCFCGRELGAIWKLFCALREIYVKKALEDAGIPADIAIEVLQLTPAQTNLSGVFEALELLECCRTRINTQHLYYQSR